MTMKTMTNEELQTLVAELTARIEILESKPTKTRNYGPKSETAMTDEIAWQILFGDAHRSKMSVAKAATHFGVSRGQVYSLGDYTFRHIKETSFMYDDDRNVVEYKES